MQVPFAKKWEKEAARLRKIALDCDLTEELKWGKPCFTFQKKNVAIVIPLKESCAFSFFKGALLKDPKKILHRIGEHTQAGRWIKFTSIKEISALQEFVDRFRSVTSKASQAMSKLKQIERMELIEKPLPPKKPFRFQIPQPPRSGHRGLGCGAC